MSGAGKKPVVDTTIHVLDQSDSEIDLLEKEIDKFELEPITSAKSEPIKPKKSPTPKKKEVGTAVKAPRTKKKINLKKSKEKLLAAPLIQPEDEEIFDKYWKTKPVAVSRMYNFTELSIGGVDLVKFVEPFEWKSFFHIKETVYPLLVQAFYFNAQVFPEKDLITSNIKDVELVVDPYVIEAKTSGDADPTTESEKLVTTAAATLQGFKPMPVPPHTTMFSALMTSSQGSLSSFCTSEFIRNILTSDTPEISTMPIPNPTDSTLPSIPSSFATFDSFCSSVNAANAGTQQLVFEGNVNFVFPGPSRPTKRFRLETNMEQMRKNLDIVIKGMAVQHSMMDHLILESKTLRTWFTTVVCPQIHIPPPLEIETPQFAPFPATDDKSDDYDCPTTTPAPDGATE
ncbi:hypothetical protein TSUD_279800 [Trifolium subterraneum]|uniref:Uncharacterized protein n=1 Tax=Trifolium subterraneum TaxID=3900 RepID=A0A2Z6N908_TRISU|nr:hypothetical protein TSUD_279800 [Trifolium subterraneum]